MWLTSGIDFFYLFIFIIVYKYVYYISYRKLLGPWLIIKDYEALWVLVFYVLLL